MAGGRPQLPLLRMAVFTALGIAAGALLARLSDALWWQVLPWVLLAALWIYVLVRPRRGGLWARGNGSDPRAS